MMNEAQFLLSLGMTPLPPRRGLAAPPVVRNIYREDKKWVMDTDLGGLVRVKGAAYDEATP